MDGEFEHILEQNERFVEAFDRSALTAAPLTGLAILTCMDARIDVEDALGLRVGDAHIIRNAGSFEDIDQMVRDQVEILATEPALLDVPVRGLVYEVETGRLREVS